MLRSPTATAANAAVPHRPASSVRRDAAIKGRDPSPMYSVTPTASSARPPAVSVLVSALVNASDSMTSDPVARTRTAPRVSRGSSATMLSTRASVVRAGPSSLNSSLGRTVMNWRRSAWVARRPWNSSHQETLNPVPSSWAWNTPAATCSMVRSSVSLSAAASCMAPSSALMSPTSVGSRSRSRIQRENRETLAERSWSRSSSR